MPSGDRIGWDEFEAIASGKSTKDTSPKMTWDEFEAALEPEVPGKPSALRSAASGLLGGAAGIVDAFEAIGSALAPGGGILAGRSAPKDNPLASLSADIRGARDIVVPPEQRGRGGIFTEDVPEILGGMVPGVVGGAINPALGAAAFGAQAGGPAYFEVIQAGGTPEEGMVALVGNAALAQLERVGAGGAFTKAIKKLSGSPVGLKAINSLAAHFAIGGTKEVGTEVVEQIGHDMILAGLTPQEVNVLDNALAIGKDKAVWVVGLLGAGAEAAAGRKGPQAAPAAPGARPPTPTAAQPHPGPIAPQGQPGAPAAQPGAEGAGVLGESAYFEANRPRAVRDLEAGAEGGGDMLGRPSTYARPQGAGVLGESAYFPANQSRVLRDLEGGDGGGGELGGEPGVQPEPEADTIESPEDLAKFLRGSYELIKTDMYGNPLPQVQQQQALTAEPEPAKNAYVEPVQKSRRDELAGRKPHELTYEEAEEALQLEREHVKSADVLALGEDGAKEWKRLQRQASSSDDRVSGPALRKIQEMEAGFTPEQNRLLYGIGEAGMNEDTLRDLSRALGDVRSAQDEDDLGRIVGLSLVNARDADPDTVDPSSREALAIAKLAEAKRVIEERGLDSEAVTRAALKRAQEVYGDDAPEMLSRWIPASQKPTARRAPPPAPAKALPAPAPEPTPAQPEPVATPAEQPAPSAEVPKKRRRTKDGATVVSREEMARVEALQGELRAAINNPDLVGKQRADRIEGLRNLIEWHQNPDSLARLERGVEFGNEVAYTGVTNKDGFREFLFLEGQRAGQYGVAATPEMKAESVKRAQDEWREQQAAFRRLKETPPVQESAKFTPPETAPEVKRKELSPEQREMRRLGLTEQAYARYKADPVGFYEDKLAALKGRRDKFTGSETSSEFSDNDLSIQIAEKQLAEEKAKIKAHPKVPPGYRYAGTLDGNRLAYNKNGSFVAVGEDGSNLGSWPIPSGEGLTGRLRRLAAEDKFEPADDIAEFVSGERAKVKAERDKAAEEAAVAERRRIASDAVRERHREKFYSSSAKWKKGSFSVSVGDGKQSVSGKTSADGLWGIRKVDRGRLDKEGPWEITHIPSGLRVGPGQHSEGAAKAYVGRLAESGTDWTAQKPDASKSTGLRRAVEKSDVFAPTEAEIDAELAAQDAENPAPGVNPRAKGAGAPTPEASGKADSGGTPPPKKPRGGATEMFAGGPNPFGKFSNISTSKFKKWAKKWLSSPGNKPRDVRREMELAEGATDAEMIEGGRYAKQIDAALRKADPNWRSTETAEQVDDAFEGDEAALRALPAEAQAAIADMRAHVDRLSREHLKKGGVIDPEKSPDMAKTILGNIGKYARRQYKAYLDPEWADKVPADVRDSLFRLWQSWAQDMDPADMMDLRRSARQRTSEGEAAFKRRRELSNQIAKLKRGDPRRAELVKERASLRLTAKKYTAEAQAARTEIAGRKAFRGKSDEDIRAEMDATLQAAKEKTQNPFKDIASGKLGRKDLSIYKRRKAIPAELRAFLGEVKDPIANYATSIFKLSQNVARHEAAVNIRKMGLGKFLFDKPTGDAVAKLTAEGNRSLAPLDGLYVTPELKAALVEATKVDASLLTKAILRLNSAVKTGLVLYQPWAPARNLLGNVPMMIANGHLPRFFSGKEWKAAWGSGELQFLKKLKRLGIVDSNISTAEWDDVKRAAKASPEEIAKGALDPGPAGKVHGAVVKAFHATDNIAKIRNFFAEEAALLEAGYSPAEAERMAADRTRDLLPTPERMPEALKRFRRQPVFGQFFAFSAEVIRTSVNRIALTAQELKSDNPKVREMGMRRVVGQVVALSAAKAAAYTWNMLNGVDAEEDEDKRNFLPEWDENSIIVWLGEQAEGTYFDISDLDPFSLFSAPLARLLSGARPEDVAEAFVREELARFTGLTPIAQLANELYNGKKRDGAPIHDKWAHIIDAVQPGVVRAVRRGIKNEDPLSEAASIAGARRYKFNVRESLAFDSARYSRIQSEAKSKQGYLTRKDPEGIKGYTQELEMTREEAFDEMARKAQAALRLGVPPREVRKILSESLSATEASAIISGKYRPHKESRKVLAP